MNCKANMNKNRFERVKSFDSGTVYVYILGFIYQIKRCVEKSFIFLFFLRGAFAVLQGKMDSDFLLLKIKLEDILGNGDILQLEVVDNV